MEFFTSSDYKDSYGNDSSSPLFATGMNNGPSVMNSTVKVRSAYLKKVYGILSVQLALTTVMSVAIMMIPSLQGFIFNNSWIIFLSLFGNLVTTFGLIYKRHDYPMNFYLLGAFTVFQSLSLGVLVSQYDLDIVVQAFFLTTAIVAGLTFYSFTTKSDFSWLGSGLSTILTGLIFGGIIHLFFGNSFTETSLAVLGACLFSGYIIYDTQMIMKYLSAEEYIIGVLNLYLDIVNLFIKILKILQALKSEEKQKEKRKRN